MLVCGHLPSTLDSSRSIKLEVGEYAHAIPHGGRTDYNYYGERIGGGPTETYRMPDTVELLGLLCKQLTRSLPNADIGLMNGEYFHEEDQIILSSVLSDIERMELGRKRIPFERTRL